MKVLLVFISIQLLYGIKADHFNPDVYLDVPQMISRHGYQSETHIVVSEDGYLIRVHRISGSKSGSNKGHQPVLLQHGLFGSSADWIVNGNQSLAFMLADLGYDVWLGNARGNYYSKGHISLSTNSAQYWNFSWHEMGTIDLPAVLYHISNETNRPGEIIYVGHSMGTTQFFVLASSLPQVAKNVKVMVALAPVAYMTHIQSPIRYLAPFVDDFQWLAKYLDLNQFLPKSKLLELLEYECDLFKYEKQICENLVFLLCGFDKSGFNDEQLPVILSHDPAGASTRTVLHYAQEIKNDGKFQKWDYGAIGNQIAYGQTTPPEYNLMNIKRPLYFMYAKNDLLASYIDVRRLAAKLSPTIIDSYLVPDAQFDHIDFIFGKHAPELIYKPLINVIKNYTIY